MNFLGQFIFENGAVGKGKCDIVFLEITLRIKPLVDGK